MSLHTLFRPLAVVGIALTLGGVYLVAVPRRSAETDSSHGDGYWRGVLLASIAAVGWSLRTTRRIGP